MQILMGEIINGDNSNTFSIIRYGLGNIKMIENLVSVGLTTDMWGNGNIFIYKESK